MRGKHIKCKPRNFDLEEKLEKQNVNQNE